MATFIMVIAITAAIAVPFLLLVIFILSLFGKEATQKGLVVLAVLVAVSIIGSLTAWGLFHKQKNYIVLPEFEQQIATFSAENQGS